MDFFPENVLRAGLVLCILYAGSARADLSKTVLDSARPDDVLTGKYSMRELSRFKRPMTWFRRWMS
ncbi:hypothetical protein AB4Y38_42435 [Paraburkholderia sp. EG285A]|uniref:hypothetical protein n=1 Tax=Paraburkholderia sp. EG285A TaxID=3237009 RepID=UPI0034D16637